MIEMVVEGIGKTLIQAKANEYTLGQWGFVNLLTDMSLHMVLRSSHGLAEHDMVALRAGCRIAAGAFWHRNKLKAAEVIITEDGRVFGHNDVAPDMPARGREVQG